MQITFAFTLLSRSSSLWLPWRVRAAVLKAVRTPRSELQRALRRNGIAVAIMGTGEESLLWTDAAGYVDDKDAAAAVSHAEHRIIGRINTLFD